MGMGSLTSEEIRRAVQLALAEDVGSGDVTTLATVPETAVARAVMKTREPLVPAGLALAEAAFLELSPGMKIEPLAKDGQSVKEGQDLLRIEGPARAILSAERVALNFVQRLSGVATLTAQFVAAIKDNHLAALRNESPNAVAAAVQRARAQYPQLKIEVEADTLDQVEQAVAAGADFVLLDNMNLIQLRLAVQQAKGRSQTEASGGVNLASVRAIAETGVDFISVGALTHSARAVDIGLDFEP